MISHELDDRASISCGARDYPHPRTLSDVSFGIIQNYSKRSIHFQKIILRKLLLLNQCPVYGWKGNLSKF
jgi:hypothetical protein